jgi:galactokinase/mevalonate kinase-like predicted kinase
MDLLHCICLLQDALSAAMAAFNTTASRCSTEDDQCEKLAAWVNFTASVSSQLQLVYERIKRQGAEVAVVQLQQGLLSKNSAIHSYKRGMLELDDHSDTLDGLQGHMRCELCMLDCIQ